MRRTTLAMVLMMLPFNALAGGGRSEMPGQAPPSRVADLTVHEWGTFTSIADANGGDVTWQPLDGLVDEPTFVHTSPHLPPDGHGIPGTVRMETPVLYFYSPKVVNVSVEVGFPSGLITEFYPNAIDSGSGVNWGTITVMPGATPIFPRVEGPTRYYEARATDANALRVETARGPEFEKFLFYRGIGSPALPLSVRMEGKNLRIEKRATGLARVMHASPAIPWAIVFENRDGEIHWRLVDPNGGAAIARPDSGDMAGLEQTLESLLVSTGLFDKEARAMIATWRDGWFEEGLRVFYPMPPSATDEVLPLTLHPKPVSLVRVLIARTEVFTSERIQAAHDELHGAMEAPESERPAQRAALIAKYGRFSGPLLDRAVSSDGERTAVAELLAH